VFDVGGSGNRFLSVDSSSAADEAVFKYVYY
jgi:hypothetical protein